MTHQLSPTGRSVWTKIQSSSISRQSCRCLSRQPQAGRDADASHDEGQIEQTSTRQPGLPQEFVKRVDLTSKSISTPVGDLPLSPLMDPTFHEAKMRHKMPKAPESSVHKKVKWRRTLERNPWAHALASDIRKCPLTNATVPKFFLQDFNFVSHPETGRPWFVPTSLASPRTRSTPEQQPDVQGKQAEEELKADQHQPNPAHLSVGQSEGKPPAKKSTRSTSPAGPTCYMMARQDLLASQIAGTGSIYVHGYKKMMAVSHSSDRFGFKEAVWREDMASLVLELMRRRIVEDLVYFAKLGEDTTRKSYIVRCDTWDEIKDEQYNGHRGCILWFGESETGPGSLATMDIPGVRFGHKIPVHNMHTLLGPEHVAKLKEETTLFRDGFLFMLIRTRTMDLQLKLWKLEGYLAHPFESSSGLSRR